MTLILSYKSYIAAFFLKKKKLRRSNES